MPVQREKKSTLWIALVLAVATIGGAALYEVLKPREQYRGAAPEGIPTQYPVLEQEVTTMEEVARINAGKPIPRPVTLKPPPLQREDHIRGELDREITVIEYASFDSLYSRIVQKPLINFLATNEATMHWVFRQFPGEDPRQHRIAELSECVALQLGNRAFWQFADNVFTLRFTDDDSIYRAAEAVGADREELRTCVESGRTYDYVLVDKREAQSQLKIYVTPSFVFINNKTGEVRVVEGLNTTDYLQEVLNAMTAE